MGARFLPAADPEGLACKWPGTGRGAAQPELSPHSPFPRQPLLRAVEALSSLASEAARTLEVEQPLGLEIQKLTAKMQASVVPPDSGSVSVCQLGFWAGDHAVSWESLLDFPLLASCSLLWKKFRYACDSNRLMVTCDPYPLAAPR